MIKKERMISCLVKSVLIIGYTLLKEKNENTDEKEKNLFYKSAKKNTAYNEDSFEPDKNLDNRKPLCTDLERSHYGAYSCNRNTQYNKKNALQNPAEIYNYLTHCVYKQDKYCREAAMILVDHLKGITSCNIVCGPTGSGKSYLWEMLKRIYPHIIIINSATISMEGWKGNYKVTSFFERINSDEHKYIVVYDEFDKLVAPKITSHGDNTSASIQAELLKLVEGEKYYVKRNNKDLAIDTKRMSFVFCGSFSEKAVEISERESSSGLGFGSEQRDAVLFEQELSVEDLIEYGMIPELASRCTRIINVRPLELEDYLYLISDHPSSPIKTLEKKYTIRIEVSEDAKVRFARNAFISGLGVRNITSQLQEIVDDKIFDSFLNDNQSIKEIYID